MFVLALLAITIHTDFEGGNIAKVEKISETHFRCTVNGEVDQDKRNRQPSWFYFRMDGVEGKEITVDLTGFKGEYNYRPTDGKWAGRLRPAFSVDDRNWQIAEDVEFDAVESSLRVRLKPAGNRVWLARQAPYTERHLKALLNDIARHAFVRQESIGKSVEGRPIPLVTITNPKIDNAKKKVIWLMARQHSWESGTSWVAEGALRFLSSADPEAVRLRDGYIFKMFPMCDPDGVARGGVRFNKYGYDLNRNWDVVDPERMPEIHSQRKAVLDWVDKGNRIDLFLTLHNTESADYIQGSLTGGGAPMQELGQRFWKLLDEKTVFYSPKGPRNTTETTTAGMKGRVTVNQGLFHDRKIPAFLMELMVEPSPRLSREPGIKDRLEFGEALVRVLAAAVAAPAPTSAAQGTPADIVERNDAYGRELEQHLQNYLIEQYPERASRAWKRDYSSEQAFLKSVAPNRERYKKFLSPPELRLTGPVQRRPRPLRELPQAEWVSVPLGSLKAEGLLVFPKNTSGRVPLVIAQHGIGSFPERVFGVDDPGNAYHDYGHALVEQGFAVLAPANLYSVEKRNRIERLARLADTTLPGIEFRRMQALLDYALQDPRVDSERVGFWGISLGGMAGMFWTPLEPRIKCSIITAWFNHRRNKMALPDERYSCFLDTKEEHAFFNGWLTEFTDSDVASLICPRPLLVQHGKKDRIAHWPQVVEEFEVAKEHYRKLGLEDRIELNVHEGGHEIVLETGIPFLKRWLNVPASAEK